MSILEFDKVSYQYPSEDFDIIDQLSFRVEPGSFHCILGVSGCGKSTIFRLINGLLDPKAGEIKVGGAPIAGRKRYCGYMPQKDLLFPWRTVGENVALPLEVAGGLSKAQRQARAEAALAEVGLAGCAGKMPGELSGGMRQRAAFARTMLTGSDLLLLDEPFSALDFLTRISMQEWLLEQWQRHQKTILFITHDRHLIRGVANRIVEVKDGQITNYEGDYDYYLYKSGQLDGDVDADRSVVDEALADAGIHGKGSGAVPEKRRAGAASPTKIAVNRRRDRQGSSSAAARDGSVGADLGQPSAGGATSLEEGRPRSPPTKSSPNRCELA